MRFSSPGSSTWLCGAWALLAAGCTNSVEPPPLHVLTIGAGGVIECEHGFHDGVETDDDRAWIRHLRESGAAQPRRPILDAGPPWVPDGFVELRVAGNADCATFARAIEVLGRQGIGQWDLRLTLVSGSHTGRRLPFRLPMDPGGSICVPAERRPILLRARHAPRGAGSDDRRLEFVLAVPFVDAQAPDETSHDTLSAADATALAARLAELRVSWPERVLSIEPPSELSIDELLELEALARRTGWGESFFAGGWFVD